MASSSGVRKVGMLKILAGPESLLWLLPRAQADFEVTARQETLHWTRGKSAQGDIAGAQIKSVQRHGRGFIVELKSFGHGVKTLTFEAPSDKDAAEWAEAVEAVRASAAVAQPDGRYVGDSPATNETSIRLTYTVGGVVTSITKEFALLVIACDPKELIGVCDYSAEETAIFKELVNFTFHTTLMKVKVNPDKLQAHGVIFAPTPLDRLDGSVYGFRNESAKQFGLDVANGMQYNLVTVYQLLGSNQTWTPDQFQQVLEQQLKSLAWWPFGENYEIRTSVTTPYFDHFSGAELRAGRPWDLLGGQGRKNTLLVHASTCFESALHCWGYAGLMLDTVPGARRALPQDKNAPIAILGAGVSGLLFATRLTGLGYTNLQILETTDRYGGKTHTIIEDGPYPAGSKEPTVCELGTCYLSPAYASMVEDLKSYLACNQQIDFTQKDPGFRGIVTEGQLPPSFNADFLMAFDDYIILKAVAERGQSNNWLNRFEAKIALALDLAWYGLLHPEYVGWNPPMPASAPESLKGPFGQQTFEEFLQEHGLTAMVGSLQYGYEVQGYGSLSRIPAYYGLLWITPAITWTILADALELENTPVVTAWTKGWGDLWKQIVQKQSLNITYGARTTSIVRSERVGQSRVAPASV
jgi:hypothetical protein